jgi:hypothetical protein
MKKDKIKEKFLTELERTPIIQHATRKKYKYLTRQVLKKIL